MEKVEKSEQKKKSDQTRTIGMIVDKFGISNFSIVLQRFAEWFWNKEHA